jgi:hypothetical protein
MYVNSNSPLAIVYRYYNGTEYDLADRTWSWSRLPGITAEQLEVNSCNYSEQLTVDSAKMALTGTASDGLVGLSAMALVSRNLTAKKAVAMLQHAVVGMVAAVECTSDNEVFTTVESLLAVTPVVVSRGGSQAQVPVGTTAKFTNVTWVHHGKTGYVFVDSDHDLAHTIEITHVAVRAAFGGGSRFELGIPHGRSSTGLLGHAAYITLPGVSLSQMDSAVHDIQVHCSITVVRNTANAQAVMVEGAAKSLQGGQVQGLVVIWAGSFTTAVAFPQPLGLNVSTSHPATVIITRAGSAGYDITANDPSNNPAGLKLRVVLSVAGLTCVRADIARDRARAEPAPPHPSTESSSVVHFDLPAGLYAGQSTTLKCIVH